GLRSWNASTAPSDVHDIGNCGFAPESVGSVPGSRLEAAVGQEPADCAEPLNSGCASALPSSGFQKRFQGPGAVDWNARREPSGDHTGKAQVPVVVNLMRVPRARSTIQMSRPVSDAMVTAARLPSGENAG